MADSSHLPVEDIYHPEVDVEYLEDYVSGGYHPTLIGDMFCSGRYTVVHKLGLRGYSIMWLAWDYQRRCYLSLKVLTARASPDSHEADVLHPLMKSNLTHAGKRLIPPLLDQFWFHGPNGHHQCSVREPAGCSIAKSKDDSTNFMFPPDAARSTAAKLIEGLHLRNFLVRIPDLHGLSTAELYKRFDKPYEIPIRRVDGKPGEPDAPPHAIYPMALNMAANEVGDPKIIISDYGRSFIVSQTPSPTLYTPALYSPPEDFFDEPITHPTAADIWTLGVNLYEVLGERPLFETFAWDRDDIVAEMINTPGQPPVRWWNSWAKRCHFFEEWIFRRISTPVFRRLRQRLWDVGRGETEQTCGEPCALEDLLGVMMAFEPAERPTADQLLRPEYMVKWALPACERQKRQALPPTCS
ncbi:kinase domain-containing protein [Penicillium coprophilum]|uniref:kinase domain-containing protein n=1 Tax=Penicillium coprophilum TaxID=36646 RepID=UPI0023868741|nr:kinase domain-containing protein [Penicillium coprophilum]KAJ5153870.1 kinase domain-containing protein [Penicillium coprophilum]